MPRPPAGPPDRVSDRRNPARAGSNRRVTRNTTGWLLVVLQFALLVGIVLLPRRPVEPAALMAGTTVVVAGIVLGLWSGRLLGSALTPTPVPVVGAGLRTSGAYRLVRHPIYSAVLLAAIGFCIAVGTLWTVTGVVVLTAFFVGKSRWEDRLLADVYGDEWTAWAARTGALVPRIRSARGERE